jgi:hypothetical protein
MMIQGPNAMKTWVRLPMAWCQDSWYQDYLKPVVRLRLAINGHPESESLWTLYLYKSLFDLGWRSVDSLNGCWTHPSTGAILVTYERDLMMAAPKEREAELWELMEKKLEFDAPPKEIDKYLGAQFNLSKEEGACNGETTLTIQMSDYVREVTEQFEKELDKTLEPAPTPYLTTLDDPLRLLSEMGIHSGTASGYLLKLMVVAKACRPDILVAVTRLAQKSSRWLKFHDVSLKRIFQYLKSSVDLHLYGKLRTSDLKDCKLVLSTEADLAGDIGQYGMTEGARTTSGQWLEVRSADDSRRWPISWRSRPQLSTTRSQCEAEYIALAVAIKTEALQMVELFSAVLGRPVGLKFDDDTQCTEAVRIAFSASLRWLPCAEQLAVLAAHENYFGYFNNNFLIDEKPTTHKANIMTKRMELAEYELAVTELLGMKRIG